MYYLLFLPLVISACRRGIITEEREIKISICSTTEASCVKWMYVDKKSTGEYVYRTIVILVDVNTYNILDPSYVRNISLTQIILEKWNEGDSYHISIGVKKSCKKPFAIESIYIESAIQSYDDVVEVKPEKANKIYVYIIVTVSIVCILLFIIYITYRKTNIAKNNVGVIDDTEHFILIKLLDEKEPFIEETLGDSDTDSS
ncbi:ORF-134 [Teiidae poxvirus 1]|nr:ORF-134 [Teiidae poxvirus 1]